MSKSNPSAFTINYFWQLSLRERPGPLTYKDLTPVIHNNHKRIAISDTDVNVDRRNSAIDRPHAVSTDDSVDIWEGAVSIGLRFCQLNEWIGCVGVCNSCMFIVDNYCLTNMTVLF